MSPDIDITIIGAGVVGLAVAAAVAGEHRAVYILEKNAAFGRETSSRNSGTIHTGILSPAGSLNARLCIEGNRLIYELCEKYDIAHCRLGKVLIAADSDEVGRLEALARRTDEGINLSVLSKTQLGYFEPGLRGEAALLLPDAGVVDAYGLMHAFLGLATHRGAQLVCGTEVTGIHKHGDGYTVRYTDCDGGGELQSRVVVNCAGLDSDRLAAMPGIADGPRNHCFKGEYYSINAAKAARMSQRLVYPMLPPDLLVGIHTVINVDGSLKLGPHFYPVDTIDYAMDDSRRGVFLQGIRKLYPFVAGEDIEPETCGVMPRSYSMNEPFREFYIRHEADRGLLGLINLVGIESPGLTAAPAIGNHVAGLVEEALVG